MGKATYTVTVTNNSNGVSVDYETETPMTLLVPEVAAEVIKDLVNTVRSYPVRQYPSSANTLNNSKHLVRWKTAPYIPALKDGVLRRTR